MQAFFIRIILIALIIIGVRFFIKRKDKYKLITNNIFWLCCSWLVCLFFYYFSGIKYKIELDVISLIYIFAFWGIFFIGQYVTQKIEDKGKSKINLFKSDEKEDFSKKINLFPLFVVSAVCTVIYVIYILIVNNIQLGTTRELDTNWFTTILQVFVCSSLVIWLYELAYSILNDKKITIWGAISVIIFNIPGFIISGRDALIICIVSTFIIFLYCGIYVQKVQKKECKMFKLAIKVFAIAFAIILLYLIFLTKNRYGQGSDSALNMFSWSAGAEFPAYLKWIYNYLGGLGKVIINVIFYYSSQFSKFALVFNKYDGPYLYGMRQLHYISRLLPESWNLNYTLVSDALQEITTEAGVSGLKVFWETAIGYSIYDFGRIGSLIIAFICGIIAQKVNIICKDNKNILEIVFKTFLCLAMFLTVELSPLFDYFYIFPLFWLIAICLYSKKTRKDNK